MKLGQESRLVTAFITALSLASALGCPSGHPENDGTFLAEGTLEDVGMFLLNKVEYPPFPLPGGPIYTNNFFGYLHFYPAGQPIESLRYEFPADAAWASDGGFAVTALNPANPSDTISVAGSAVNPDADGSTDAFDVTIDLGGGDVRDLTLPRVDFFAYDNYKCWHDEATPFCFPSAGTPTCTFTPDGPSTYAAHVVVPWKDADANLPTGSLEIGVRDSASGGTRTCGLQFASPSATCLDTTFTASVSGTTEGTIEIDAGNFAIPAGFDQFTVALDDGPLSAPAVACDLP